jgi:hypothetical protein
MPIKPYWDTLPEALPFAMPTRHDFRYVSTCFTQIDHAMHIVSAQ